MCIFKIKRVKPITKRYIVTFEVEPVKEVETLTGFDLTDFVFETLGYTKVIKPTRVIKYVII